VVAVLLAVLAWRLSSGPVSLSILSQIMEDVVSSQLEGGEIDIGDTILRWSPERRQISMRVIDVTVNGADGNRVTTLPELSFRLSMAALVRGEIAPTSVELYGVSTTLIRRPTGITLGLAAADAPPSQDDTGFVIGPMLEALMGENDNMPMLAYFRRFGIHDATITVVDEVNDVTFEAPNANLAFFRGPGGLAGSLSADLKLDNTVGHIELEGALPEGDDNATARLKVDNIVLAAIGRMSPAFAAYGYIDAPLSATGDLTISRKGVVRGANLKVNAGAGQFTILALKQAPVSLEKAYAELTLDAEKKRVDLRRLDLQAGPHNISLTGHADYQLGEGIRLQTALVELKAGNTTTEIADFFEGPVTFDNAYFRGTLDFEKRQIDVAEISLGVAGGLVKGSGIVGEGARSPALDAKVRLSNIPVNEARAAWPIPLSHKAREWVAKNLRDGTLVDANLDIDVPADLLAEVEEKHIPIPDGGLRFDFNVTGARVNFLDGMPPLTGVVARGLVANNRFDAWVSTAQVTVGPDEGVLTNRVLQMSEGHFLDDDLASRRGIGRISFTGEGRTTDILTLLNHEPLRLIRGFDLDINQVGGTGKVSAVLTLPLVKGVTIDEVDFKGTAHADNVMIPNIQPDLSITSGTLDITIDREGLRAIGPVGLNGAAPLDLVWKERFKRGTGATPNSSFQLTGDIDNAGRKAVGLKFDKYIDGPAYIDATLTGSGSKLDRAKIHADLTASKVTLDYLGWIKEPGTKVTLDTDLAIRPDGFSFSGFQLSGEGVDAAGEFAMDRKWDWQSISFPQITLGPDNYLSIRGRRNDEGALSLDINGLRANASLLLRNVVGGDGSTQADPQAAAEAAQRLVTPEMLADKSRRTVIRAAIGTVLGQNATRFSNLDARFTLIDDWVYTFNVEASDESGQPLVARIAPDGPQARAFTVNSPDAGLVFNALDLAEGVTGGTMKASATIDDTQAGSPMKGTVDVSKFRIVNAPVLAKILTLGSLTGIGDTMSGDGIYFDHLVLPFRVTGSRIYVEDARMAGPAIGLTLQGQVDRVNDVLELEGTLVPAYTLNSVLGNVPVLGPLLIGREGEGIFGVTYAVKGSTENPSVIVNPLSAIAPGFLRRIFEFGSSMPPEAAPTTSVDVAPQDKAPAPAPEPAPAP
tara:strand:- start:5887 stop:9342 length:3456 start_codon:yes stop_codon:yes gene_type:complete